MCDSLTQEKLKALLHYDPDTGAFTRLTGRTRGKTVRTAPRGYIIVSVDGRLFRAHRLAFLYMTGEWPAQDVDHINGVRSDNRWCNLRAVGNVVNRENMRTPMSSNVSSGILGVTWHRRANKWMAQIQVRGAYKYLGLYSTKEEAGAAYLMAKRELHEGCTI